MITPYGDIPVITGITNQSTGHPYSEKEAIRIFNKPRTVHELVTRELIFFQFACEEGFDGYEGPGRFHHCRLLCDTLWRQKGVESFVWHPWLEDQLEEYCQSGISDNVIVTGPGSGGKTMGAAMYANLFWRCNPSITGELLCSTTRDGLKKRLWGDVRNLYVAASKVCGGVGHLIDSNLCIQSSKGDEKHGIYGIAVALGEEQKALGRIIGFHPRRILVAVDELTDVSWAIIEALTNLFTGKQKKKFIGIGNAASIFDSHGKMAEPMDGWGSVTVDSPRWPTKRGGVCIHFDGFKCENVIKGEKIYPFLLTKENIADTARDYGMDSPQMWRMRRGFWAPDGTTRSVLTESIIQRCRAMAEPVWRGDFIDGMALDPAFEGGDRCVVRHVRWGEGEGGNETLWLDKPQIIKIDVGSKVPVHYQIAGQVKERAQEWHVDVRNFGMDSTGEGGGLASIIATEWEPGFVQIEFGGKASDFPISKVNKKPCHEEYYNRVTELWHFMRTLVLGGQLRGLDAETAIELSTRLFTVENKIRLESKADMKKRLGGRSPDLADNAVVAAALARERGGLGIQEPVISKSLAREWDALVKEFAVEDEDAFTYEAIANL